MAFRGKVVFITGGAQGIGSACRVAFANSGAHVSVLDLHPPEAADDSLCWTTGDVTDPETRREAVAKTLERYGRIDILVNNVVIGLYSNPSSTPPDLVPALGRRERYGDRRDVQSGNAAHAIAEQRRNRQHRIH